MALFALIIILLAVHFESWTPTDLRSEPSPTRRFMLRAGLNWKNSRGFLMNGERVDHLDKFPANDHIWTLQ